MDELEIAGKQYISTRRAGREHGYHSDYIGQLIRGKKVQGQKVGRSWYVDAESLAVYLGKEPVAAVAPKVAVVEPAPVVVTEQPQEEQAPVAEVVEVVVAEPIKKEVEIVEKEEVVANPVEEKVVEEVQVPIKIVEEKAVVETPVAIQKEETAVSPSGLVYVHDDAPSLPQVRTAASDAYAATPMAQAAVTFAPQHALSISKSLALVSLLGLALVIGVGAAAYLSLNVRVIDQTATSYYGIQK